MMREGLIELWCFALATLLILCVVAVLDAQPKQSAQARNAYWPFSVETSVKDSPILSTRQQIEAARSTGMCAIFIGDDHFLLVELPAGYIDYSARYGRML